MDVVRSAGGSKLAGLRRGALAACASALAFFGVAAPASAGQIVYERGGEIWVMNDDGSDQRQLVTPGDLPTFADLARGDPFARPESLDDPHVDPDGGILVFDALFDANPDDSDWGLRADGIYKLDGGAITRHSLDPLEAADISHFESEPEATGDGRFVFSSWICNSSNIYACSSAIYVQSLDDDGEDGELQTRQNHGTACDDSLWLGSPSPNPVNPSRVVYVGCSDYIPGQGFVEQLIVGGPNNTDPVVVDTDGYEFAHPSWRPDGAKIVVIQQDEAPGIYTYNPDGSAERRVLVADQFKVGGVRYIGNATIAFELSYEAGDGDDDPEYDIFTIPANCSSCTTADATQLTFDGDSGSPAWTGQGGLGGGAELAVTNAKVAEGVAAQRAPASQLSFKVRRTGNLGAATVDYRTIDGTATQPGDYRRTVGTLSFAAGQASKAVNVRVTDDQLDELDETVTLKLSNPTGDGTIVDSVGRGTILDDDPQPTLSVADVTLPEGDADTTLARFKVTLSAASGRTVDVAYATTDATATQPSDYASRAGTLSFAPGATTRTVSVPVRGDTVVEPNERFRLNLSAPTAATLADGVGVALITNDD